MKILFRHTRVFTFLLTLLLLGGTASEAWATKVTYHILTLPINNTTYNMKSEINGKRLEAIRVIVDDATKVGDLPEHFKSPLAKEFKYWTSSSFTKTTGQNLYDGKERKSDIYSSAAGSQTQLSEGDDVGSNTEIYVTYDYDDSKEIKLDGTVAYNIPIDGGFLAYNRGRNNRIAVVPKEYVKTEHLISEDFIKVDVSGLNTYYSGNNSWTSQDAIGSQYHFLFKLEGSDPYNIIIRTAINSGEKSYVEDKKYKYYAGGTLFSKGNANVFLSSNDHTEYTSAWSTKGEAVPNPLETTVKTGNYHNEGDPIWNSFALLNNTNSPSDGYVFAATRTNTPTKDGSSYKYYYLRDNDKNTFAIDKETPESATSKFSTDDTKFYTIQDVYFKVRTPFGNDVSASIKLSQYSIDNDVIKLNDVPNELRRKYCSFTGKFYKDAACTQAITEYSEMEGNIVYVGYQVSESIRFKAITPAASYTEDTWKAATWYELTDAGSEEENGKKLKYDGTNFKNNGASGTFEKNTEYAFIGDPYELRVVLRSATSGAIATYVGAASTSDGTALTASTTASAGYRWEIPNDDTNGSFELRQLNGTGKWYWNETQLTQSFAYDTKSHTYDIPTANAQTITVTITGLTVGESYYIEVTKGGTNSGQVTVTGEKIYVQADGTATFTADVKSKGTGNKQFTLSVQEYNSSDATVESPAAPSVITFNQNSDATANATVQYSTSSSTRVKVLTLPTRTYTYKIVDKAGNIAVKASIDQTIFSPLTIASIPSIIVSPFILDETVKFYRTYGGSGRSALATEITQTDNVNHDIFVTYTTTRLINKPITLSEDQEFNVKLNGEYLYYDSSDKKIKSKSLASGSSELSQRVYLWKLRGSDPYHMLIDNLGARDDNSVTGNETPDVYDDKGTKTNPERQKGAWVDLVSIVNEGALSITTTRTDAQHFIAKSSTQGGVYEVMVATGDDAIDASTTYFNIGNKGTQEIKIYDQAAYAHGNDVLRFTLEQQTGYTYHLIDLAHHELLQVKSNSPDLILPAEYQSPLVATYSYYAADQMTINDKGTPSDKSDDDYTPTDAKIKLASLSDLFAVYTSTGITAGEYTGNLTADNESDLTAKARELAATGTYDYKIGTEEPYTYQRINVSRAFRGLDIYVTYTVNDLVKFNDKASPYLLKFHHGGSYKLEDGNDKLTTGDPIKAVYPYCNGDGSLNIYGQDMNEEQMNGGASTRPRWTWFFESTNSDPYHVKIHSKNTIAFKDVNHPTYLQTEAVHFNQDDSESTPHIVTRGALPGIAGVQPTEYMILGTQGQFKLKTTNLVNGTNQDVRSFEQYWKTYNMIKLDVLGIDPKAEGPYKDEFSNDESTWTVPEAQRSTLQDRLETLGIGRGKWHSYDVIANAVRWNGYNDKSDGHEKKVVEKLEHWFQTFDMGDGTFDIISADIPPVLVLLDRHGWEIMRKPLPRSSTYPYGEELDSLRAYDSPMVKEYKFYSNATKASGCHKYTLRLDDKTKAERDQIKFKTTGKHYTSTSLADLPPIDATGVLSNGAINDFFVTYTVKDEFEKGYKYTLNADYTETVSSTDYLYLQNQRFAKEVKNAEAYLSKPMREATDPIGGGAYDMLLHPQTKTVNNVSHSVDDNKDGKIDDVNLWYVRPNLDIDNEMGIKWGTSDDITAAEPLSENATKKKYEQQTGFDPYNLQIARRTDGKLFTIQLTKAELVNGSWVGTLSDKGLRLEAAKSGETAVNADGYDHTTLKMTNQTFMAVSDDKGNMQLMPRFDHTRRVNVEFKAPYHTTLEEPVNHTQKATPESNESMGAQTVFFVRPQRFTYRIIDNEGYEALRFRSACESEPTVPDRFASPLAKDFKFYLKADSTTVDGKKKFTIDENSEITSSFVDKLTGTDLSALDINIYVRYSYDEEGDYQGILKGKWFTTKLNEKDVQSTEETIESDGTGVSLYAGNNPLVGNANDKPATIGVNAEKWQWKFLQSPIDPSSSDLHKYPDPYAIHIFNRKANYSTDLSASSPLATPIKVSDKDRFVLLNHSSGGYALATAGLGTFNYSYLNGANMTVPSTTAASVVEEGETIKKTLTAKESYSNADFAALKLSDGVYYFRIPGTAVLYGTLFTYKKVTISGGAGAVSGEPETITREQWENALSEGTKLTLMDDVTHEYTYHVINNAGTLAVDGTQTYEQAVENEFAPVLPEAAQTPLLNITDYKYYGSATENAGTYSVVNDTKLFTLYGLYDDEVYVRYNPYSMDTSPYKAPNKRNATDSDPATTIARHDDSNDATININGELPYNIIWYNDNMMSATTESGTTTITNGGSQELGGGDFVWRFCNNDPYALTIKHKKSDNYINGTGTLVAEGSAKNFMLLKKEGYDYGILQVTGTTGTDAGKKLTGYGNALTDDSDDAPTKFIIFGLPVHDLIYHLLIANIGSHVDTPYREGNENSHKDAGWADWSDSFKKEIPGTTMRDLTSVNTGEGTHYAGEKYQLGEVISWDDSFYTYSHDAGQVTVGDVLEVPSVFKRPNCNYYYYIEGIYDGGNTDTKPITLTDPVATLNNKYKGLELTRLPKDDDLVGKYVVVNVAYGFQTGLPTNAGEGFVTKVNDNYWYTFQTSDATPYLAQFTSAGGMKVLAGRATRYTNDYLWTPVGDVYGFKMYNRYMHKNIGNTSNVMTKADINSGGELEVATHGDNDVFELLSTDTVGFFRVHPVANTPDQTQHYVYRDASDNKIKLSTNYTEWTFGLGTDLLKPYIDRKGYVGGLTSTAYTTNKEVLDKVTNGTADYADLRTVQRIVYNDDNIVPYSPGYYRLHSQPGIAGMPTVRYASGYLHDIEQTAVSGGIPMHLYSREGVSTTFEGTKGDDVLGSGFTVTDATRGDIPVPATEYDPSTIFHFPGTATGTTIGTQELYVVANANGDANNGKKDSKLQRAAMAESGGEVFNVMDIGGAIVLLHDGATATERRYLNYDQDVEVDGKKMIYDLKYYHSANTEESRWCMQPVQKTATAGDGEMPLMIRTNNGGDNYYYTTFYAPFDVLLTDVAATADTPAKTYQAFYCTEWNDNGLHPTMVPATNSYAEGKFIPAETPVIIRTDDESGSIKVTLPNDIPSSKILRNIFMGEYLELLLPLDATRDVYTLGLPFTSEVSKAANYDNTGDISAPLPEQANNGLGFYINATPNKEASSGQSTWTRNNRYVLHNKIYYRAPVSSSRTRGPEFVPLLFEAAATDVQGVLRPGNVYNLQGRCVATEEMVKDGTWKNNLTPGVYIMSGKKIIVK